MLAQNRYDQILHVLRTSGSIQVASLARELGVSQATVRRDLQVLANGGLIRRVHGGAAPKADDEPPFAEAVISNLPAKDAVAISAAGLVKDGDVILLDIGTTMLQLAKHLHGRPITVVTSNLAVLDELVDDRAVELVVLGGVVRRNYRSLNGYLTEAALSQLRVRCLFLGTSGVRPDGSVMDTTAVEVPVKRLMMKIADRVVLLADASKFPGTGMSRVCGCDSVHTVITNKEVDSAALQPIEESGTTVIRA